jgi:hypothetical protein
MKRRTKKVLFAGALVVFALVGYVALMYAVGYKYSFSDARFLRTGAVALRVNTGAKIYLDDVLLGNTSFFNNAFSEDGLLPGNYVLSLQREGFSGWSKTVVVDEGYVTDFPSIILLPLSGEEKDKLIEEIKEIFILSTAAKATPTPTPKVSPVRSKSPVPSISPAPQIKEPFVLKKNILYRNIENELVKLADSVNGYILSEDDNKIAWWTRNELWVMWLADTNYQPFKKINDKELITRFSVPIQDVVWFRGSDHLVAEFELKDVKGRPYSSYKVIEIDTRGGINIIEY